MAFRALAVPWCPLLSPSLPQSSRVPLRSRLLRGLLTLTLHFLSFDGLEVFRNIDQMSSSCKVYSVFLIIAWDHRFEGEDYRREVPFSQCLKGCAMLCWLGTPVGFSTGNVSLTCSVAVEQEREEKKGRHRELFRADKCQNTPLVVLYGTCLPHSLPWEHIWSTCRSLMLHVQLVYLNLPCFCSIHPQTWWLIFRNLLVKKKKNVCKAIEGRTLKCLLKE